MDIPKLNPGNTIVVTERLSVPNPRITRKECPSVIPMSADDAAALLAKGRDAEATLSAAALCLLLSLHREQIGILGRDDSENIMRKGAKSESVKNLIEEKILTPVFGSKDARKGKPQPNTWTSTKSTVLAYLAAGHNPYIADEAGEIVGYVPLAAMREQLKKPSNKSSTDPLEVIGEQLGRCNLEQLKQLLGEVGERIKVWEEAETKMVEEQKPVLLLSVN